MTTYNYISPVLVRDRLVDLVSATQIFQDNFTDAITKYDPATVSEAKGTDCCLTIRGNSWESMSIGPRGASKICKDTIIVLQVYVHFAANTRDQATLDICVNKTTAMIQALFGFEKDPTPQSGANPFLYWRQMKLIGEPIQTLYYPSPEGWYMSETPILLKADQNK